MKKRKFIANYFFVALLGVFVFSGCFGGDSSSGSENSAKESSKDDGAVEMRDLKKIQNLPTRSELAKLTPMSEDKLIEALPETFAGEKRKSVKKKTFMYEDVSSVTGGYGDPVGTQGKNMYVLGQEVVVWIVIIDSAGKTGSNQTMAPRYRIRGKETEKRGTYSSTLIEIDGVKGYNVLSGGSSTTYEVSLIIGRFWVAVRSIKLTPSELVDAIKKSDLIKNVKAL